MNRRKQLECLEAKAERKRREAREQRSPLTSEEWLEIYEARERKGYFKAEPDFPLALAEFREALAEAQRSTDPPWDPPADFMPTGTSPRWRLYYWRDLQGRFPKKNQAFFWCLNIWSRVEDGVPPVTEAEFTMLVEWVKDNDERIRALVKDEHGIIDLGNGETRGSWEFRWLRQEGLKGSKTGVLMEAVRKVKALLDDKNRTTPSTLLAEGGRSFQ